MKLQPPRLLLHEDSYSLEMDTLPAIVQNPPTIPSDAPIIRVSYKTICGHRIDVSEPPQPITASVKTTSDSDPAVTSHAIAITESRMLMRRDVKAFTGPLLLMTGNVKVSLGSEQDVACSAQTIRLRDQNM